MILPRWTVTYVREDNDQVKKTVEVFGQSVLQAWYVGMSIIQIIERTEKYQIKSVNPKYAE